MDNEDFPFPGPRILSQWVADEVKGQFYLGASTDEILSVVKQVLDRHEASYGARPGPA